MFGQGRLDDALALLSDDVSWELYGPRTIPYFGSYRGRDGVKRFFDKLFQVEEILEFVPEEFISGEYEVVVIGREQCRAKSSGKEFSAHWAQVFSVRDGKVCRFREFIDNHSMVIAYSS